MFMFYYGNVSTLHPRTIFKCILLIKCWIYKTNSDAIQSLALVFSSFIKCNRSDVIELNTGLCRFLKIAQLFFSK